MAPLDKQSDSDERDVVYTVGHSNHSLEEFLKLLQNAQVTAIADVRSAPYSSYSPHFNKDALKEALKDHGIAYVYLGKELGGRSDDPSYFDGDRVSYQRLAETHLFLEGLKRVREGAARYKIALMCSEKDPLDCHRHLLVSRKLSEDGVQVLHILSDGTIEDHAATEARMLGSSNSEQGDMFHAARLVDPLVEAYERQAKSVAYRRSDDRNDKALRKTA
ncbi:MAG: DUF488 domain-containing protein [Proteobacteria bacterium]|nr:DUF488 domain-containing protein [Pseudomonadota bacterium]